MQICYTGSRAVKNSVGERLAIAFEKTFCEFDFSVNLFTPTPSKNCRREDFPEKEIYSDCFKEYVKNESFFIMLLVDPSGSEYAAWEHEVINARVKSKSKKNNNVKYFVFGFNVIEFDKMRTLFADTDIKEFDEDSLSDLMAELSSDSFHHPHVDWMKTFRSHLCKNILASINVDFSFNIDILFGIESFADSIRHLHANLVIDEIQSEIERMQTEQSIAEGNSELPAEKSIESAKSIEFKNKVSLSRIQHNFMLGTLERAQSGINAIQGNEVQIRDNPVEEFWTSGIMQESNKVIATNIEEFKGSYGRQVKEKLFSVQAGSILRMKQEMGPLSEIGEIHKDWGISRIFVYNDHELMYEEKLKPLTDVMIAQSLIGIEVYAIPDWDFDGIFSSYFDDWGERDFIIINNEALYITKKDLDGNVKSTELINPDGDSSSFSNLRIGLAKKTVSSIMECPSIYKVGLKYQFESSENTFLKRMLSNEQSQVFNDALRKLEADDFCFSLLEFFNEIKAVIIYFAEGGNKNNRNIFMHQLCSGFYVDGVKAINSFSWPTSFDENLKIRYGDTLLSKISSDDLKKLNSTYKTYRLFDDFVNAFSKDAWPEDILRLNFSQLLEDKKYDRTADESVVDYKYLKWLMFTGEFDGMEASTGILSKYSKTSNINCFKVSYQNESGGFEEIGIVEYLVGYILKSEGYENYYLKPFINSSVSTI